MSLSQRLSKLMIEQNLTEAALGQKAGISQQAIHKIVTGETQNPRNLIAIASALDVDPTWLAHGKGLKQKPLVAPSYQAAKEKTLLPIHPLMQSFDAHIFHLYKNTITRQLVLPESLSQRHGLYGFYMPSHLMAPRFKTGDLIIADAYQPPRAGEDCLIIHKDMDENITPISILCFSHMKDNEIMAYQYTPHKEFWFQLQNITLHRILQIEDFLA